jgi:hypothetical protein
LEPKRLGELAEFAHSLGMEVLMEVHDLQELESSLNPHLDLVGVNNRSLKTFDVSLDTSFSLVDRIPNEFVKISESGISEPETLDPTQKRWFSRVFDWRKFHEDQPSTAGRAQLHECLSQPFGTTKGYSGAAMSLKVCGMRDPDNIRDLVEVVQPDWMGLIFYPPSPRFVENALAESIRNFRVNKVGVFVNASMEEIYEKAGLFGLDAIQLHGDESPEFAKMLKDKTGKSVWKVFLVGEEMYWEKLLPYQNIVDYFLFDTFSKSHGEVE